MMILNALMRVYQCVLESQYIYLVTQHLMHDQKSGYLNNNCCDLYSDHIFFINYFSFKTSFDTVMILFTLYRLMWLINDQNRKLFFTLGSIAVYCVLWQ